MPRPPTAKKAKPPKPDFVFPPGGAALAAVPGLRLNPRTGDVPRWWPVDTPGKAAFACNVPGVVWFERSKKWTLQHTSAVTNKRERLGYFDTFEDACVARAQSVDGATGKGTLLVAEGQLLVSKCAHNCCNRTQIPATEFAPDVFKFKKKFSKYEAALALLVNGLSDIARHEINKWRVGNCLRCRGMQRSSRNEGEHSEPAKCRRAVVEIKSRWIMKGGCAACGCRDADVLSGDHKNREGKEVHEQQLTPRWWASNGGVEAMLKHYLGPETTVQCLCHFCHALERSHSIHKGKHPDECGDSDAKLKREYTLAKRAHVNAEKLRRGKCEHPLCCDPCTGQARVVTSETCHAFHFAHKNDADKDFGIANMVGLNNFSPATAIPKLDKEMRKCNVYCANCHHKYDTLPRLKEGQELLDALLARGAPVGTRAVKDERDDYFADMTDEERNAAFESLECGECE